MPECQGIWPVDWLFIWFLFYMPLRPDKFTYYISMAKWCYLNEYRWRAQINIRDVVWWTAIRVTDHWKVHCIRPKGCWEMLIKIYKSLQCRRKIHWISVCQVCNRIGIVQLPAGRLDIVTLYLVVAFLLAVVPLGGTVWQRLLPLTLQCFEESLICECGTKSSN